MPQIYKDAVVTLSAAVASDCGQGFLEDRQAVLQRQQTVFCLPSIPDDGGINTDPAVVGSVFLYLNSDLGFKVRDLRDEPINSRAWTLQESWLSPRMLVYGSGPLEWRCLTKNVSYGNEVSSIKDRASHTYLPNRSKFFKSQAESGLITSLIQAWVSFVSAGPVDSKENSSLQDYAKLMEEWNGIVQQYTCRSLTVREDKLPALSGIAAEFQRLSGDVYLAGLWQRNLPWGLLWHMFPDEMTGSQIADVNKSYVAPSWSFASIEKPVLFNAPIDYARNTLIQIHSAETIASMSLAPLGKVTSGKLTLTGPMRCMTFKEITERFVTVTNFTPHLFWDYIIADHGFTGPPWVEASKLARPYSLNEQYSISNPVSSLLSATTVKYMPTNRAIPQDGEASIPGDIRTGMDFWFLEITWDDSPRGLVLIEVGDRIFKRLGYFRMGRNDPIDVDDFPLPPEYFGPRPWDWDEGLKMCTVTIV